MDSAMTFLDIVRKRFSVRRYLPQKVDRNLILKAIEAARLAPSACNAQPWHFIIVDDSARVKELAKATFLPLSKLNRFVTGAPVIIVVVSERPNLSSEIGGRIKNKPYYLIDIGIAFEHFCLQASEDNLGTCIVGWFDEKRIKKFLHVPGNREIPLLITLGYPEPGFQTVKHRRKLESIYSFDIYR